MKKNKIYFHEQDFHHNYGVHIWVDKNYELKNKLKEYWLVNRYNRSVLMFLQSESTDYLFIEFLNLEYNDALKYAQKICMELNTKLEKEDTL